MLRSWKDSVEGKTNCLNRRYLTKMKKLEPVCKRWAKCNKLNLHWISHWLNNFNVSLCGQMGYDFSSCGSFRRLQRQRGVHVICPWQHQDLCGKCDHLHDHHHQAKPEPLAVCKGLLHAETLQRCCIQGQRCSNTQSRKKESQSQNKERKVHICLTDLRAFKISTHKVSEGHQTHHSLHGEFYTVPRR